MHRITRNSDANRNNMGHYNRLDQAIDRAMNGQTNITSIIRRWEEPENKPAHRPLRERIGDQPSTPKGGVRIRVYAHSETGDHYLGLALSEATLEALVTLGYLQAEAVSLRGRMGGETIEQTYEREEVA